MDVVKVGYRDADFLALVKSLISHHYQRSMMNRFSTDIAKGGCRIGGGNVNRRCPEGHLLQFALPCGEQQTTPGTL